MKTISRFLASAFLAGAIGSTVSAASVCPTTPYTTSDCSFLITIGANGAATVSMIAGESPFNGPKTFVDGTSDPGSDGSLVGVINNDPNALMSFTLTGCRRQRRYFRFLVQRNLRLYQRRLLCYCDDRLRRSHHYL